MSELRETLSERARAVWDRVVEDRGVPATATGADGLAAYATAVARLEDARERIDRDGLIVADAKGQPVPHPALALERALQADLQKLRQGLRR